MVLVIRLVSSFVINQCGYFLYLLSTSKLVEQLLLEGWWGNVYQGRESHRPIDPEAEDGWVVFQKIFISLVYFRQKLFSTRWRTAIIPFKVLMTFVLSFCKLSSVFRSSCWQATSLKEERREPSSRRVEGPGVNLRIQLIKGVKGLNETSFFRNYLLNSRTAQTPPT